MQSSKHHPCPKCNKVMLRRSLWTHLKVVHRLDEEELLSIRKDVNRECGVTRVNCPICEELFATHKELAQHCHGTHSGDGAGGRPQDYSMLNITFANEQEYESWFIEKCNTTCSSLSIERIITEGSTTKRYLHCNRAYKKESTSTERVTESKKDVRYCSCHLVVRLEADGRVSVEGCFGHVGHELDPALLRLTTQQKFYLRTLLEEYSMDYIIKKLRKEDPARSTKLSFVVKKDLVNIVTRYNMRPGWRHDDDVASVQLRCDENNSDDGIRVFEPPQNPNGTGFLMVIITPTMLDWLKKYSCKGVTLDDTFHTTRYNLKLATLMVTDERDRGLPAAYLLSGTMTSRDVQRMFEEIRKLMPDFEPRKIVTDEAPCFYNGFRAVFPQASTRLHYCRFHILQTWKRNMNKLVEPSLRPHLQIALRNLLMETQLPVFQKRFAEILAYLRAKGQDQMVDYLEKNYLGRTPSWASFANKGAVHDTTMISERFHLRIKEEFLNRNANMRVDAFVEILIRAVEEMSESIDVKERRRFVASAYRLNETHKKHKAAVTAYKRNCDDVAQISQESWQVQNAAHTKVFDVTWEGPCSCDPQKNTHCLKCGVCAYEWMCTCLDNRSGISCVHRHAVKMRITEMEEELANIPSTSGAPTAVVSSVPEEEVAIAEEEVAITEAQKRQEIRFQAYSTYKMKIAVLDASCAQLLRQDTDEAVQRLREVIAMVDLAIDTANVPQVGRLVPRPELTQAGTKPKLSKIPLHRRSAVRKTEGAEEGDGLQSEVQLLRTLSPFKDVNK